MLRGIGRRILMLIIILLSGVLVKNLIDSFWRFSGLDPKGLPSLIVIVTMMFSATFLIPLKSSFKNRVKRVFKEVLLFLLIWLAASFSAAILHSSSYIQIGFLLALSFFFFRLGAFPRVRRIGLRILCEEQPVELRAHTLLLSVAPVPKAVFLHGFGLKETARILKEGARIRLRLPEDVFMKSFKNRQTLEFRGSLSSLVETVRENIADGTAIMCEARPHEDSFKIKVEIASDSLQALRRLVESLSRLSPGPERSVEHALEDWRSLKPCVKPVSEALGFSLNPEPLAGRILIAGDRRDAEKLALQICLSQLRRDSIVLVTDDGEKPGDGSGSENGVEKLLVEKGFRLRKKPVKTYRGRDGAEVVFADSSSNKPLLKKISSKPVVAVWLRNRVQGLTVDAPMEILTSGEPQAHSGFEANSMILVNCERRLVESFLPFRYGFALEGKTVLVSQKGVRILR